MLLTNTPHSNNVTDITIYFQILWNYSYCAQMYSLVTIVHIDIDSLCCNHKQGKFSYTWQKITELMSV